MFFSLSRLYLTSPRYELLDDSDKAQYFQDRNVYNKMRRTGSRALYFASCSDQNEVGAAYLCRICTNKNSC